MVKPRMRERRRTFIAPLREYPLSVLQFTQQRALALHTVQPKYCDSSQAEFLP